MKQLAAYLHGLRTGLLQQDDHGLLSFTYDAEWLNRPDAMPLSRSLPLRQEPFRGRDARPFFAGILPDEDPREQIALVLGISRNNDFAMLERIGGECAGAVSLLPADAPPPAQEDQGTRSLSDAELASAIAELPHRPLLAGEHGLRLSLAGSQDKLPVVLEDDRIALPLGSTPSTHIIKPEPPRFPDLVAVEAFCMQLARLSGLEVPDIAMRRIGDRPCILVQRYDRTVAEDQTVTRIHQEDFCQAMGFPPERKYQQEGGPLLRDCVAMLREWSTEPVLDIRDFLDALIFNVIIGNADAHAKNHSLRYRGGQRRLAPLYDLVATIHWPQLSTTPAMKIGRSESMHSITSENWQKMSAECGLGWPMVRQRVMERCERTAAALAVAGLQHPASELHRQLADQIGARMSAMLRTFGR